MPIRLRWESVKLARFCEANSAWVEPVRLCDSGSCGDVLDLCTWLSDEMWVWRPTWRDFWVGQKKQQHGVLLRKLRFVTQARLNLHHVSPRETTTFSFRPSFCLNNLKLSFRCLGWGFISSPLHGFPCEFCLCATSWKHFNSFTV